MAIKTLFTSIDQIKEYITVDISSDFRTISPYIKQAEKYTTDIIGTTLHASLLTVVHDGVVDSDLSLLLDKVRLALANFGYMLAIAKLNVNVGDAGFTVTVSNNLEPASQWRVIDFKNSVKDAGYDALEDLIEFLEANRTTYPDWATSDAYSYQKQFFVNNAKEVNDAIFIGLSRIKFLELKPFIHQIEQSVILPTMCSQLYNLIKTQIIDDNISTDNLLLLNSYIRPAISYLALDKHTKDDNYKLEGTRYAEQLKDYLNENAATYDVYLSSDCYEDPVTEEEINDEDSGFFVFGG